MPATYNIYSPLANGAYLLDVPFPFIDRDHAQVREAAHGNTGSPFEWTLLEEGMDYIWLTDGQIELVLPANGTTDYIVQRVTPRLPLAVMQGGVFSSQLVNLDFRQLAYCLEEQQDLLFNLYAMEGGGSPVPLPDPATYSSGMVKVVTTRVDLKAIDLTKHQVAFLNEGTRKGNFAWRLGNYSAEVAADPLGGIYLKADAFATTVGAWVRDWNGAEAWVEWFGAKVEDPTFDNRAAFNACVAMAAVIRFSHGDYTILGTWKMDKSGKTLTGILGAGSTVGFGTDSSNPTGMHAGTRIVLRGAAVATQNVVQFGMDYSDLDDLGQMRNSTMMDICAARDCTTFRANPAPTNDPSGCLKGFLLSYLSDCYIDRCWSYDNPVGFQTVGAVITKVRHCNTRRVTPGSSPTNDFFVGFMTGGYGAASFGYIGNSASIYFDHCHCFDQPAEFDTSWGMYMFGRIADTFVSNFEMARLDFGIEIDGGATRGGAAMSNAQASAQQDVEIINAKLDGCNLGGIYVHDTHDWHWFDIINPYVTASGGYAIKFLRSAGMNSLTGGRLGAGGVHVEMVNGFEMHGTQIRDSSSPAVYLKNCVGCIIHYVHFAFQVHHVHSALIENCARVKLEAVVRGAPAMITNAVSIFATTNSEINATCADPGSFDTISPAFKIRFNSQDASTGAGATAFAAADNHITGSIV